MCTHCVTMSARIQVIFDSITSVCLDLTQTSWFPLLGYAHAFPCKCEKIFLTGRTQCALFVTAMASPGQTDSARPLHKCTNNI